MPPVQPSSTASSSAAMAVLLVRTSGILRRRVTRAVHAAEEGGLPKPIKTLIKDESDKRNKAKAA